MSSTNTRLKIKIFVISIFRGSSLGTEGQISSLFSGGGRVSKKDGFWRLKRHPENDMLNLQRKMQHRNARDWDFLMLRRAGYGLGRLG